MHRRRGRHGHSGVGRHSHASKHPTCGGVQRGGVHHIHTPLCQVRKRAQCLQLTILALHGEHRHRDRLCLCDVGDVFIKGGGLAERAHPHIGNAVRAHHNLTASQAAGDADCKGDGGAESGATRGTQLGDTTSNPPRTRHRLKQSAPRDISARTRCEFTRWRCCHRMSLSRRPVVCTRRPLVPYIVTSAPNVMTATRHSGLSLSKASICAATAACTHWRRVGVALSRSTAASYRSNALALCASVRAAWTSVSRCLAAASS
mmetsp:Transcript_55773/g.121430  ORF Transcript_55773/g.121430 Transcript_55773/m.121430 type:complete len:260 (+) Transcript_55773:680-1459(+)